MPLRLTPQMKQRMTRRTLEMVQRSLGYFPELKDASITIGYTRKHLGSATVIYRKHELYRLIIRLRVRKVTYHTIGHELTHLVQGLAYGHRGARSADPSHIPVGETQCDIWTLARDPLFLDDPPTYIKMPRMMRERWPDYAESVRELCIVCNRQTPHPAPVHPLAWNKKFGNWRKHRSASNQPAQRSCFCRS